MKKHFVLVACLVVVTSFLAALANDTPALTGSANSVLPPFKFDRRAAASPEAAARSMFQGVSAESPKHFVQHLCLGGCDGSIDTLQKFAEAMHKTEFTHAGERFTFYDLREMRRGINPKQPIVIIATAPFDSEDARVRALEREMMSTYFGEAFAAVEVETKGYDGLDYQTRIVVAKVDGGWYAIPRCRSAKNFYEIADAMRLTPPESKKDK